MSLHLNNFILLPVDVSRTASNVDFDLTPRSVASDRGLHCLFRPVYPNVFVLFGLYVAFNNLSVISQRYLDVAGSSMLTFRVLPH